MMVLIMIGMLIMGIVCFMTIVTMCGHVLLGIIHPTFFPVEHHEIHTE